MAWLITTLLSLPCQGAIADGLEQPEHAALRQAYEAGAVVLSPNPHTHALLTDKRNLSVLSEAVLLKGWGAAGERLARLEAVPTFLQ